MLGTDSSQPRAGRSELAQRAFLAVSLTALSAGALLHVTGLAGPAHAAWAGATALGLIPASWWVVEAVRAHRLGADVLALLALAGTLAVGEYLAGAVITVMLASGRSLESWADGRAHRELRLLVERAPRVAHLTCGDEISDVPAAEISTGDLLTVKPGEVVPVDGYLERSPAVLDESALTGEAEPSEHPVGDLLRSGTVNAGGPFQLRAASTAADSTYAGIVRLVSEAEASSAPSARLADRYAGLFLGVSLTVSAGAWALAGSASRAVAVLVVATPCPLILAVPVALVSGLSRAAHRGVVVKGGAVLERLATARVLLFDKTGTLTTGRPTVAVVISTGAVSESDLLQLCASLDQVSPHVLAAAIVRAARERQQSLIAPARVTEVAGSGIRGDVGGRRVRVGKANWVAPDAGPAWTRQIRRRADRDGMLSVFVAIDERPAGAILLSDPIRPDASRTIRRLRRDGITRVVMVTGDRLEAAEAVGAMIGVDEVLAERTPAEKADAVQLEQRRGPVMMVGDGINDAPALALADVGVAFGASGATSSTEAADVVLTVDRLDRLGEAAVIARRARRIALQSVLAGIGLSFAAMAAATAGKLPAAWGALAQELIDVAVILNALRALLGERSAAGLAGADAALARRFSAEHVILRPEVEAVRSAADAIGVSAPADALRLAREVYQALVDDVVPHEMAEDTQLYPVLARALGGVDPTGTMSRAHSEITHQTRRLGRLLAEAGDAEPDPEDLLDIRRLLYSLHAILALHFAQEEENYLSLADEADAPDSHAEHRPTASALR